MLVAILVAGNEYNPEKGIRWVRCCLSREKHLARRFRSVMFSAITFDVALGTLTRALYKPGGSAPTRTTTAIREPIRPDQYKRLPNGDNVPFKRLESIMSIMDIYSETLKQLVELDGKIVEFSFFSHAYADGPILTNTWAYRRVVGDGPLARLVDLQQSPGNSRDPADLDPRKQDFLPSVPPAPSVQSAEALARWKTAFAENGVSWIWGCNSDNDVLRLMRVVRRAIPPITPNSNPESFVQITPRGPELASINHVAPHLLQTAKRSGTFQVQLGNLRKFILDRLHDTYAQRLADATGRPTYAAGPGTYATFQNNGVDLEVPGLVRDVVQTYRSAFGVSSDQEGRHYLQYNPAGTAGRL